MGVSHAGRKGPCVARAGDGAMATDADQLSVHGLARQCGAAKADKGDSGAAKGQRDASRDDDPQKAGGVGVDVRESISAIVGTAEIVA